MESIKSARKIFTYLTKKKQVDYNKRYETDIINSALFIIKYLFNFGNFETFHNYWMRLVTYSTCTQWHFSV